MFVRRVGGSVGALLGALGVHLLDVGTVGKPGSSHVVGTERHRVGVTSVGVLEVSSSHHSSALEPVPRSVNLPAVTPIGVTVVGSAAASSVGSGQESGELAISLDAESVVVGFGGSVCPA